MKGIKFALLSGFLASASSAAAQEIQVYGKLDMDFERVAATGSTAVAGTPPVAGGNDKPWRNRVSSNSSYIGIKGENSLQDEMKAFFQIECGLSQDTGSAAVISSTGNGISNTFASRNSALGLMGNPGTLFFGSWETPYRLAFNVLDPFGYTGLGGFSLLGNGHTTNPNNGNLVSFSRRQNNSVQYWTPDLGGASVKVAYSANEEKPAVGTVSTTIPSGYNPSLFSISGTYTTGPLYGYLGYERHDDYTSVGHADHAVNLGGAYSFEGTRVGVAFEQLHYLFGGAAANVDAAINPYVKAGATTVSTSGDLKINTLAFFVSRDVGANGHIRAAYEHARDATGSALIAGARTGARKITFGYGLTMSKNTELYAVYSKINNNANGTYDFTTNLIGTAPTGGANPEGVGVGIKYVF